MAINMNNMKMKAVLFGMTLIFAASAGAATTAYDLKMELSLNGKHVFSPKLLVSTGEVASVTQKTKNQETFIEVVATDAAVKGSNGILMEFTVGYIGKDGKRTIVSQPRILALENEPAQITVGDGRKGKEDISLSVIAKRQTSEPEQKKQ